jgi:hypothetical protein
MRSFRWILSICAFFLVVSGTAAMLRADDKGDAPRALLHAVNPTTAHAGETAVATGEQLSKRYVAALYLTNGKDDFEVEILKQTDTELTFKVPTNVKGNLRLMILTSGVEPKLAEQPVRITVE